MLLENNQLINNAATPIILCKEDGTVIFRNRACKNVIPLLTLNCNINQYKDIRFEPYEKSYGTVSITALINNASLFRRALIFSVIENDKRYKLWFFYSLIQLCDPEDITLELLAAYNKSAPRILDFIMSDISGFRDEPIRHTRMSNYILGTLAGSEESVKGQEFPVTKVIDSIKNLTCTILPKFNYRVTFDTMTLDPDHSAGMKFRSFAVIYSQITLLLLKLSGGKRIDISAGQMKDVLILSFSTSLKRSFGENISGDTLYLLGEQFPEEYLNLIFLDHHIDMMDYHIEYTIVPEKNDSINVQLAVPIVSKAKVLCMPLPEFFAETEFDRAVKQISRYIEAVIALLDE